MIEFALRALVVVAAVATPLWLVLHAVVLARSRKPVLYCELQQLGRQGDPLARIAFMAWDAAIVAATGLCAIAAMRLFD